MDGKSCARLLVIAGFTRIHAAIDSSTVKELAEAAASAMGAMWQWLRPRRRMVFWLASLAAIALLLVMFVIRGGASWIWREYHSNQQDLAPILTLAAGIAVASVALIRHFAQTDADRQRRITESFTKAVEHLGTDKLEVRLGGIYSLERISKESPADYWTVMENLTAFVGERSVRTEAARTILDFEHRVSQRAHFLWIEDGRPEGQAEKHWAQAVELEELGEPPATDIVTVLTVIKRRSDRSREREGINNWRLDLSGAVLKQSRLVAMHLESADLGLAHLEGANPWQAHLEGANLWQAHLEWADLQGAHLEGANLEGAHLKWANLRGAHLEGTDLRASWGLSSAFLHDAHGDAATQLPEGMARPAHWPSPTTPASRCRR